MIEIKLTFATIAEAAQALANMGGVTVAPQPAPLTSGSAPAPEATKPGKSAKTAAAASSPPTAAPAPAPAPAASETPAPASQPAELPYAPIGQRIAEMVNAGNPNSAANRTAIKAFFATLAERYGTLVKTGQDVKAEDRPALIACLDAAADSAMS
jgi:hypothetical protein